MSTIQTLRDLVTLSETQHDPTDRITGSEVRAVDNALITEVANRGVLHAASISDLASISKDETGNVFISNVGFFAVKETLDPPDNVRTFSSPHPGVLWENKLPIGVLINWIISNFQPIDATPPPPPPPPF